MDEVSSFGERSSWCNDLWWHRNRNTRSKRINNVVREYDEHQQRPFGREKLNQVRKLFFENNLSEGNHVAGNMMAGSPHSVGTHLPIGDLKINFHILKEKYQIIAMNWIYILL